MNLKLRVRHAWKNTSVAVRNGLAGFGLVVLAFLAFDGGRFVPIHAAQAGSMAFGKMKTEAPTALPVAVTEDQEVRAHPHHRAIAGYLARRYRVALDATEKLVADAFVAADATGLDPLLILAVMAVESSMNPIAESDFGAKGLMQVVPRFHLEKLALHGGEDALLKPKINILVGAQILAEYIRRAGALETGLQLYGGAPEDAERGYARKVLAEQFRLKDALARAPRRGTDA